MNEQSIYRISLIVTGIINYVMAWFLLRGTRQFGKYPIYRLARICTVVWLMAFGIGYQLHAIFQWRYIWPTAASALTASYFHIAAVCFSWGYTSLLNPEYLTRNIKIRDIMFFIVGIICYWSVALTWAYAPLYTSLSFCVFFVHALIVTFTFYRTYNRVSYRMMKMSLGNVRSFVRWMQMCCDLIILVGIGSVAITAIFPTDVWPFTVMLVAGVGMFGYMVYSLDKYGAVIDDATAATLNVLDIEKHRK